MVSPTFENTGTLTVNAATLQFDGPTYLAGTVTGSGTLELSGATALQSGLGLSVAALTIGGGTVDLGENLGYANIFSQIQGGVLDLGGNTLSLSGAASLDSGTLTDIGTLAASGATTIGAYTIEDGAVLSVTGIGEQTGQVILSGGTLAVAAGGSYTFDDDVSIIGSGVLSLAGTLLVGGTGDSTIDAAVNQNRRHADCERSDIDAGGRRHAGGRGVGHGFARSGGWPVHAGIDAECHRGGYRPWRWRHREPGGACELWRHFPR